VLDYDAAGEHVQREFGQRVSFSHDGLPALAYSSYTWLLDEERTGPTQGEGPAAREAGRERAVGTLATELGYWRLSRTLLPEDAGPGLLPGSDTRPFGTAQSVETLRNAAGGFDIEVQLLHPDGISELYLGQIKGARIDLATDAVMRTAGAKDYAAATRLYGLVESHLLWAWDIAALGQELRSHASARLARIDLADPAALPSARPTADAAAQDPEAAAPDPRDS
jgi:hypothetical protein